MCEIKQDQKQDQQSRQNRQLSENRQERQEANLQNQAANQPLQRQNAAGEGNIIQELGLQQEQVIQAVPNPDDAVKQEIRKAHLALHRHQADDKKQGDKKKAYDKKIKLREPSKMLLKEHKDNFEIIFTIVANHMGVDPAALLQDSAATTANSMRILFGDQEGRIRSVMKALQLNVMADGTTNEQILEKRHELERIFSVFLEFDMTTLDFEKAEDLNREDMKAKLAIIDLCPKIADYMNDYRQLLGMGVGCLVTERMMREIQARSAVIERYGKAYRERLSLMGNKYYALLLNEDTADASTRKLREKLDAAVADNNQELVEYLRMILDKRKAKKDGTYTAANRGDKALDLLKTEREKLGLKGDEGLEAPGMDRINAQAHGLAEQITPERYARVLNSKRREIDQKFSSVVYDSGHRPQHCLLVSANESCVFVKLILSLRKTPDIDTKPLLVQLNGFFQTLLTQVGTKDAAREICFEAANPELLPFLRNMAGQDIFKMVCTDMYAVTFI